MAGTKITGLTIKIGADTRELSAALKSVNKQLNTTNADLKAVQRSLKFNPGNTELLKQQQRAYQSAVEATEEKLGKLRQAQKDMEAAGVTKEQQAQYDALRREIIKTENQLERLKTASILSGNASTGLEKIAYGMQRISGGFGRVSTTAGKWSQSLGNVSSKLSGINRAILGVSAAAAAVFLRAGWNRMEKMDTARTKMKAIGLSAEDTASAMESANKAVLGTSYGLDSAASAAAQAAAAGVQQGREMDEWLKAISDSAAVAGVGFEEMGDIFTKVATGGKATNRELQQLAKRGIPVYQYLADELGTTSDEVFNMAKRGEIDMATFRRAIAHNIGGAAKELGSSTITGAVELVRSAIARVGEAFLGSSDDANSFAGQIHDVLLDLRGAIDGLKPAAKEMGAQFGKTFKVVYTYIKTGKYYGDSLSGAFAAIAGSIKIVIDAIKLAGRAFGAMPEWAKKATILTGVLGAPLTKAASGAFGAISSLTGALSRGSAKLAEWSANKAAKATMDGVGSAAAKATGKIASVVGAISKLALPVAAVAGAVALLAPAIARLGQNKEIDALTDKIRTLKGETDLLIESTRMNTQAAFDSIQEAQGNAYAVDALANKIITLDGVRNKSNEQIEEEKALIKELNKQVPDLNLAYDETTGKLNMTTDELKKTVDAWKKEAKAEAYAQSITEAYKNIAQLEAQRPKLIDAQREAQEKAAAAWERYNNAAQSGAGKERLTQLRGQALDADKALQEATNAVNQLDGEITENQNNINLWTGEISGANEKARQEFQSLSSVATGALNSLPTSSKAKGQQAGNAIAQGLRETLGNVKGAGKSTGAAEMSGVAIGISENGSLPKNATISQIKKARSAGRAISWKDIGTAAMNGIAAGIRSNNAAISSASSAVQKMYEAARKKAKINSPSKLFRDGVGLSIGEGLAAGIDQSTIYAIKAAEGQISDIEKTYSGMNAELTTSANSLSGAMNYAAANDMPTEGQQMTSAMIQGLAQIGAALVSAMPDNIVLDVNGRQLATAIWGDLASEAQRQGKVLAVDSNTVKGLASA